MRRTSLFSGRVVWGEPPTPATGGGLAREGQRRRRPLGERAADQPPATDELQHDAPAQPDRGARTRPAGRQRATARLQDTLSWIAPREQRYRQCDRRREAEQGVQHGNEHYSRPVWRRRRFRASRRDGAERRTLGESSVTLSRVGATKHAHRECSKFWYARRIGDERLVNVRQGLDLVRDRGRSQRSGPGRTRLSTEEK